MLVNFSQIYCEPQQQKLVFPIGFRTPEYLGFLKLQVVLGLPVRYVYITRIRKREPGYRNLSNDPVLLQEEIRGNCHLSKIIICRPAAWKDKCLAKPKIGRTRHALHGQRTK